MSKLVRSKQRWKWTHEAERPVLEREAAPRLAQGRPGVGPRESEDFFDYGTSPDFTERLPLPERLGMRRAKISGRFSVKTDPDDFQGRPQ